MRQILEGSRAIALTINNIRPGVISAYPITPQTHIVEDLAQFKADGKADYEYVRAESEFAAASIVEGASATGVRVYTATSSQGLLLMSEVVYNIAGMRLPVVMTCANRAVSAPISIWNDQQDAMAIRDAGWIMFFAENAQEAVIQHILAYKISEKLNLPSIINVDGYVLTHTYEPVIIPATEEIGKFLPDYAPAKGNYLDPEAPATFGAFAAPPYYMEIRQELHTDLIASKTQICTEYENYKKLFPVQFEHKEDKQIPDSPSLAVDKQSPISDPLSRSIDHPFYEYYGPDDPHTIVVAMGSVVGTIKDAVDGFNASKSGAKKKAGVLKIKLFRPFPGEEILPLLMKAKKIAVVDKAISLGHIGPLASDLRASTDIKPEKIKSFVTGLGGRDITREKIIAIIKSASKSNKSLGSEFIG